MKQLVLKDFLQITEAVTGLNPTALAATRHVVDRAESALAAPFAAFDGREMYPGVAPKAAILCSRILRNHPLPDGNKRVAYLCMIELIRRNDCEWVPVASAEERATMVEQLAAREVDEERFAVWVEAQMTSAR